MEKQEWISSLNGDELLSPIDALKESLEKRHVSEEDNTDNNGHHRRAQTDANGPQDPYKAIIKVLSDSQLDRWNRSNLSSIDLNKLHAQAERLLLNLLVHNNGKFRAIRGLPEAQQSWDTAVFKLIGAEASDGNLLTALSLANLARNRTIFDKYLVNIIYWHALYRSKRNSKADEDSLGKIIELIRNKEDKEIAQRLLTTGKVPINDRFKRESRYQHLQH